MHIVIGLLVAFVIVALYSRRTRATRACRWRADRTGDRGAERFFRCAACGATAYTSSGALPGRCARIAGR